MNTLIVSGGNINYDFALDFMKKRTWDCVIAADRGMEFLKKAGVLPHWIVGDFDSGSRELLEYYREQGTQIRTFQPEKDYTDTEIAMGLALELKSDNISLLGATGSRLDHVLGSIRNLSMALEAGVACELVDEHNRIRMADKPLTIKRREQFGRYVSLLAFGGEVRGITLTGFYYPLTDYTMAAWDAVGISNEIVEEEAHISFSEGKLLVIESRD